MPAWSWRKRPYGLKRWFRQRARPMPDDQNVRAAILLGLAAPEPSLTRSGRLQADPGFLAGRHRWCRGVGICQAYIVGPRGVQKFKLRHRPDFGCRASCVAKKEPADPKNRLMSVPQVLITPHIAGFTDLTWAATVNHINQVLEEFVAGKKPNSILNNP